MLPGGSFDIEAARTPRVLWVELTSKCPYDCVFCSRKFRRGSGRHLPYQTYQRLVTGLQDPRRLVLNYSGESIYYPELVPAIELARSRGAFVELVSAFSSIQSELMRGLASCGLGRLTLSVHARDPGRYAEIYRYSSFTALEERLIEFLGLCARSASPPAVDFAFVAMESNLGELRGVAEFARRMGVRDIQVFPVMRRDDIPAQFPNELDGRGNHREAFVRGVAAAVRESESAVEGVRITVSNPAFGGPSACLGEVPAPFPGELPAGARIHSCEQNPWETAHVLSNSDVVACEVLDRIVLGSLEEQSIEEIWTSEGYRRFRQLYAAGQQAECRCCVWKRAYRPGPLRSEILARNGLSAQLRYGWHEPSGEDVVWSTQQAAAILQPRPGSRSIHVSGLLPQGPSGDPNELAITCDGRDVGRVTNPWAETMPFGLDFAVPDGTGHPWRLEFRTKHMLRPRDRGLGPDARDLGFALVLVASNRAANGQQMAAQALELAPLRRWVSRVDRAGRLLGRCGRPFRARLQRSERPGVSIVIPERDNAGELSACLDSVEAAAARLPEPAEVIVVVNGSPAEAYGPLHCRHPDSRWLFYAEPLGFSRAVGRGLAAARFDWVYLLNNDVTLEAGALETLLPLRAPDVFAIGSQIFLKDPTRYREETNWCVFLMEDGLVSVHDRIPPAEPVMESFYVGGGASLFHRRVLAPLLAASGAYAPFYWEDVEWGWRARKQGYRVLFCSESIAHHAQRATIARHYRPEEVEAVIERNRLLFQLRNLTQTGSLDRLFSEMARLPAASARHFLRPEVLWSSLRVRLWNHLARLDDAALTGENKAARA